MDWHALYETAKQQVDSAQGYYNHNVRIDLSDGPVMVRIPMLSADQMDLRVWPEAQILAGLTPYLPQLPRLLHASAKPPFQIQEFISGPVLNDLAPRGTPLPEHVIVDVVELFVALYDVPRCALPPAPDGWPADGDTAGFARQLTAVTAQVYERFRHQYADLYRRLKVPIDPLAAVIKGLARLHSRPFVGVHADVHRKNMIIREGRCVFLDWELTLWGDPVYDLAVHLHKMGFLPTEREQLIHLWLSRMPTAATTSWEADVASYLAHEQVKSVVVDSVRYAQQLAQPIPASLRRQLIDNLTAKIANARVHWQIPDAIDRDEVEQHLSARNRT